MILVVILNFELKINYILIIVPVLHQATFNAAAKCPK